MPVKTTENQTEVSENNDLVAKLLAKPRNTGTVAFKVGDETLKITFGALSSSEYDKLIAAHPPKADQRVEGLIFDVDTFAPALIAKCAMEPTLTLKQAQAIWSSPNFSRGDLQALLGKAMDVNQQGSNIPFFETD